MYCILYLNKKYQQFGEIWLDTWVMDGTEVYTFIHSTFVVLKTQLQLILFYVAAFVLVQNLKDPLNLRWGFLR